MSACPLEASNAVKAMSNISGCDDSDDTMFFSLSGFTDSGCLQVVRVKGCGCVVGFREAIQT